MAGIRTRTRLVKAEINFTQEEADRLIEDWQESDELWEITRNNFVPAVAYYRYCSKYPSEADKYQTLLINTFDKFLKKYNVSYNYDTLRRHVHLRISINKPLDEWDIPELKKDIRILNILEFEHYNITNEVSGEDVYNFYQKYKDTFLGKIALEKLKDIGHWEEGEEYLDYSSPSVFKDVTEYLGNKKRFLEEYQNAEYMYSAAE